MIKHPWEIQTCLPLNLLFFKPLTHLESQFSAGNQGSTPQVHLPTALEIELQGGSSNIKPQASLRDQLMLATRY